MWQRWIEDLQELGDIYDGWDSLHNRGIITVSLAKRLAEVTRQRNAYAKAAASLAERCARLERLKDKSRNNETLNW